MVGGTVVGRYRGPLAAPVDYANLQMQLRPPQPGQTPVITPEQAMSQCGVTAGCPGDAGPAQVDLARVTSQDPATINSDGSTTALVVNRLTYVMMWRNEVCYPAGGVPGAPQPTPSRCTDLELIDANTGAYETGISTNGALS